MVKAVIIFANSSKPPGRCIAGRELADTKKRKYGGWIRPVSAGGAITIRDSKLEDGSQPQLIDIVNIPIIKHSPKPGQPENYLIDPEHGWQRAGKLPPRHLEELVEEPDDLWLSDRSHPDFVTSEFIAEKPPKQSLYLIRPNGLSLNMFWWGSRKRLKVVFRYEGTTYGLQVTDPEIWGLVRSIFPGQMDSDKEIELKNGDDYYLCVSLAGQWEKKHYKLVAGIIDSKGQKTELK